MATTWRRKHPIPTQFSPKRIFTAGHSSAAVAALRLANKDDRVAGCAAYWIPADVVNFYRAQGVDDPKLALLLTRFSPLQNAGQIRCPVLLFHCAEDRIASVRDARRLAKADATHIKYVEVPRGGHYEAMTKAGIPAGIRFMRGGS